MRALSVIVDVRGVEPRLAAGEEFGEEGQNAGPDPDVTLDLRRTDRAVVEAVIASDRLPVRVEVDGITRVGYDDLAGRRLIEPMFEDGGAFVDGLARVKSKDGYGFIRPDGNVAVPLDFESALLRFSNGRTLVVSGRHVWLIDSSGRRVADLGPWKWPEMGGEEGFDDLERGTGESWQTVVLTSWGTSGERSTLACRSPN